PLGELFPVLPRKVEPEVRHGHLVTVELARGRLGCRRDQVRDYMMAEHVEVDVGPRLAALLAADGLEVERARGFEIAHGEGEVELRGGRGSHAWLSFRARCEGNAASGSRVNASARSRST